MQARGGEGGGEGTTLQLDALTLISRRPFDLSLTFDLPPTFDLMLII